MRAIWTGAVSFGLINIPVKMYSGSESRGGIDLKMLHKHDMSPIRYAKFCKQENREIEFGEIIKGYEYQDGEYVVLDEKDFEKVNAKKTGSIDIAQFAHETEIDVRYYDKPYYLEPAKGADKPYALLRAALQKSNRIAIARFVLRNREHLAAIKPVGRALVLNQLRFPAELREPNQLKLPDAEAADDKEVNMALKLVDQLTEPFIAEDFHDTFTEELEAMIQERIQGAKPKTTGKAKAEPTSGGKDIMAMLKASLDESQKAKSKR